MPRLTWTPSLAALLGAALLQLGCLSHWQAQHEPAADILAGGRHERVRVSLSDSTRLDLRGTALVGDSLTGLNADTSVTLPVGRIARVAIRKRGATQPVVILGAAALVAMAVYFAAVRDPY